MDMGKIAQHLGKIQTGWDSSFGPLDYKVLADTVQSDRVDGLSYSSRER